MQELMQTELRDSQQSLEQSLNGSSSERKRLEESLSDTVAEKRRMELSLDETMQQQTRIKNNQQVVNHIFNERLAKQEEAIEELTDRFANARQEEAKSEGETETKGGWQQQDYF